jgi:hypothetical protein
MSHKVWLQTDPPVPSHDAAEREGVSAVISCVHLAIHFLTRIGHSAKRASGRAQRSNAADAMGYQGLNLPSLTSSRQGRHLIRSAAEGLGNRYLAWRVPCQDISDSSKPGCSLFLRNMSTGNAHARVRGGRTERAGLLDKPPTGTPQTTMPSIGGTAHLSSGWLCHA